ncbi:MAG: hypothetical protein B7Z20_13295, partial [Sphingobium sp. 32-64-5]
EGEAAGAERYVLGPLAKLVAPRLLRLQIPPRHLLLGATGMALLGLALLAPGWKMLALLIFLLALTTNLVADQISAMGRMTGNGGLIRLAPDMLVLAGVAWIGMQAGMPADGLHLALLSAIAVVVLYRRERLTLPPWAYITPGSAVFLLLAGVLSGLLPAALALGAVLAIASLAAVILVGGRADNGR